MTIEEQKAKMKFIILEGMHWDGFTDLDSTIDELHTILVKESDSLLGVAKCPNSNCDNNGTIATQEYPSGEWMPEPCEWCHRKKEHLKIEI
jgi:aspartate carbamoyltransferase regulatory subunit